MYFLIVVVFVTVLSVIQSRIIASVFDGLVAKDAEVIIFSVILFFLCIFTLKEFDRFGGKQHEWIYADFHERLNSKIAKLFFEKPIGQHRAHGSMLSVSNIEKGRGRAMELWFGVIFEAVPITMKIIVSIVALLFCGIPGLIMSLVLVVYLVTSLYLNLRVIQDCTKIDSDLRKINRHFSERMDGIEKVKISGKAHEELSFISRNYKDVSTRDRDFWVWYISFSRWRSRFAIFSLSFVLAYGAWQVWNGVWTLGILFPVFTWASMAYDNFWQISSVERKIQFNMPSVRSMIKVLTIEPWFRTENRIEQVNWSLPPIISFKEISHNYNQKEKGSKPVLRNVSFEINSGEKIALVGMSGAGKSTLSYLALQFMDPSSGSVLVNGVDLRTISTESLLVGTGYVSQHAMIFDGTLRDNLVYGLDENSRKIVTDEHLWQVMKLLKIDFGLRLTNGLNTIVGKNGMKLSGGQKQRVAIGSALIKNPKFVVIDEATSHLDSTTEQLVQTGINEFFRQGVTALIIAHRLSTIKKCDKIVVLKPISEVKGNESQIEAIGTFQELVKSSKTFRNFAISQGMLRRKKKVKIES